MKNRTALFCFMALLLSSCAHSPDQPVSMAEKVQICAISYNDAHQKCENHVKNAKHGAELASRCREHYKVAHEACKNAMGDFTEIKAKCLPHYENANTICREKSTDKFSASETMAHCKMAYKPAHDSCASIVKNY